MSKVNLMVDVEGLVKEIKSLMLAAMCSSLQLTNYVYIKAKIAPYLKTIDDTNKELAKAIISKITEKYSVPWADTPQREIIMVQQMIDEIVPIITNHSPLQSKVEELKKKYDKLLDEVILAQDSGDLALKRLNDIDTSSQTIRDSNE